jgi:thiamine-phosphate pyrophosphorylase
MNPPMNKAISGLYAETPELADTAGLLARIQAVLAGGARLLQYRNKIGDDNLRHRQAAALRDLLSGPAARKFCQLLRVKVA